MDKLQAAVEEFEMAVRKFEAVRSDVIAGREYHLLFTKYSTAKAALLQAALEPWQPIDTALKDGGAILLLLPEFGMWARGWWRGSWSFSKEQWVIHTPLHVPDGRAVTLHDIPTPTHWMPLPQPPVLRHGGVE